MELRAIKFKARIEVKLRRSEVDPEGETVKRSLIDLNFPVTSAKISKVYELSFEAKSKKDAEVMAKQICTRLLVNPTKDDYKIEVVELGSTVSGKSTS
ncbi:MAG: phosphoribosylformylglycinamidine synthase subunit PurS [Nitrososphaerales archaeon]